MSPRIEQSTKSRTSKQHKTPSLTPAAAPNSNNKSASFHPFLNLPAEIRTQILMLASVKSDAIEIRHHHPFNTNLPRRRRATARYELRNSRYENDDDYDTLNRSAMAVALTSRLIYAEAIKFYYALNTFRFRVVHDIGTTYKANTDNNLRLLKFVEAIGPLNAASISSLSITYDFFNCLQNVRFISLDFIFTNLKSLHIDILTHAHMIPSEVEDFVVAQVKKDKGKEDNNIVMLTLSSRCCCLTWGNLLESYRKDLGRRYREGKGNSVGEMEGVELGKMDALC